MVLSHLFLEGFLFALSHNLGHLLVILLLALSLLPLLLHLPESLSLLGKQVLQRR